MGVAEGKNGTVGREWGGGGERAWRVNVVQILVHMYVDGKIIPVETVPGMVYGRGCG
jgi:hypothetical protein